MERDTRVRLGCLLYNLFQRKFLSNEWKSHQFASKTNTKHKKHWKNSVLHRYFHKKPISNHPALWKINEIGATYNWWNMTAFSSANARWWTSWNSEQIACSWTQNVVQKHLVDCRFYQWISKKISIFQSDDSCVSSNLRWISVVSDKKNWWLKNVKIVCDIGT